MMKMGYTAVKSGIEYVLESKLIWTDAKPFITNEASDLYITLWVPNEFINWKHYRETEEYVPVWEGVTR